MADLIRGRDLPSSDDEDADYNPLADATGEKEDVAAVRAAGGIAGNRATRGARASAEPEPEPEAGPSSDDDGATVGRRAAKRARVDAAFASLQGGGPVAPPAPGPSAPPIKAVSIASLAVPLGPADRRPAALPASRAAAAALVESLGLGAPRAMTGAISAPRPVAPATITADALAAAEAALAGAVSAAAPARDHGRVAVTETRRFAGKDVAVTRVVGEADAAKAAAAAAAAAKAAGLDAVLASLDAARKVSAVDKTRADWDGFKAARKGVDAELEDYKKSGSAHVARLEFLKRAEMAEYEADRDARLGADVRNRGRL